MDAETKGLVDALEAWAPLVEEGYEVPAAGAKMWAAAQHMKQQAATITRLTAERDEARARAERAAAERDGPERAAMARGIARNRGQERHWRTWLPESEDAARALLAMQEGGK